MTLSDDWFKLLIWYSANVLVKKNKYQLKKQIVPLLKWVLVI